MPTIQGRNNGKSIAALSTKVLDSLSALSNTGSSSVDQQPDSEPSITLENAIQRFQTWLSEHDVPKGKLDHGLRESTVLRKRVVSLLEELCDIGNELSEHSATDEAATQKAVPPSTPSVGPSTPLCDDNQSNGGRTSSSLDTAQSLQSSLPETSLTRAHDIITLLLELGPTLMDPTPLDRLDTFTNVDTAKYDFDHVKTKFPKADDRLVHRLGNANWERRQYFRNLRDTYENEPSHTPVFDNFGGSLDIDKLSQMAALTDDDDDESSDDEVLLIQQRERIFSDASSTFAENSSALNSPILTDKGSVQSEFDFSRTHSQTTLDSSIMTETDSAMSVFDTSRKGSQNTVPTEPFGEAASIDSPSRDTKYTIPPPPKSKRGFLQETILCPYCFHLLSNIKSLNEWRDHVYGDIKPYMCTYTSCTFAGKTYDSRKAWWQHETERHRITRSWTCQPCESNGNKSKFTSIQSFDDHFPLQHTVQPNSAQVQVFRNICVQDEGVSLPASECPLCRETIADAKLMDARSFERAVRDHIADHQEQLAFFVAFPAGEMVLRDNDDVFQDDSDSDDDFKSEIQSVRSKDFQFTKDNHIAKVNSFIAHQADYSLSPVQVLQDAALPMPKEEVKPSRKLSHSQPGRSGYETKPVPPTFPVKLLMHPPNEHFYARQDVLSDAEKVLASSGTICIFQGVGGVGKTLAAVQYIYTHQDGFDAVFWLQADTAPGRSDSYHQMAQALGLINDSEDYNYITNKGREWLQSTNKRWLLIFDNALKWDDISEFLPNELKKTNGSVLITTQKKDFLPPSDNVTSMTLKPLEREQGAEMLMSYLGRDLQTDPERHLAKEISVFVGGLPVAIAHVAGYIEYSEYALQELIEIFVQWRRRAGVANLEADDLPVSFREASFSYDETLNMVWNITLRELSADASEIMNILAYLNGEAIPESMLWGVHEEPDLHCLDIRERVRQRRNKTSLTRRRLVQTKTVDGEPCLAMHRSLQRGIRENLMLDKGKQQNVFDRAVTLVRKVFPQANELQQPTPKQWTEVQRLLPHLHALRDAYKYSAHIRGSIDLAQLMTDAGMDQFERGITKEGLLLLTTAEDILNREPARDHLVMRANIHAMIAIMYDNTGITQREEALERRKTALELRRKIFNDSSNKQRKDEILLYNSEMEYAISLLHYHRYDEAEPRIEKCLQKFREWDKESKIPFEYAKYYNKIALVRMYQGRFEEAIKLGARGVDLMVETGYTLFESRFKFDLACIILQSGDVDRALQVHQEVYEQRMQKLGQANELTLHSIYAIGSLYEIKEEFEEAEAWYKKCLYQRRSVTSWPEEAFSRAQFHMSKVLVAIGREEDKETAQMLHDKALRILRRLLPLDMPPELEGVEDETVLFDHMLPISPGGARFTGQDLLPYFMKGNKAKKTAKVEKKEDEENRDEGSLSKEEERERSEDEAEEAGNAEKHEDSEVEDEKNDKDHD